MKNIKNRNTKNTNTKIKSFDIAFIGISISLAFILSYIETTIPFSIGIPGIKLGLANIIVIVVLYKSGIKKAGFISIVRVVLSGFTFSNMSVMLYSAAGAVLSLVVMYFLKHTKKFSIVGVSIAGGVSHNAGQIIMAFLMLGRAVFYYLPALIIGGIATGTFIGIMGALIVKHIPDEYF